MTDAAWDAFDTSKGVSPREAMPLDMGMNPDELVESKIDPSLFLLAEWPNAFKDFKYPSCPCAMCGHLCRWVVGFRHIPSGNLILVGEDCANYLDSSNIIEKNMKMFKTKVKNEEIARAKEMKRVTALAEFTQTEPQVVRFLLSRDDNESSLFVVSLKKSLTEWGSLTGGQLAAIKKIMAARAVEANKPKPDVVLQSGRYEIEGEITTKKLKASYFGDAWKIVVTMADGNKVYGTLAKSIIDAQVSDTVKFVATVEPTKDDPYFGWFSKPTKAMILVSGDKE